MTAMPPNQMYYSAPQASPRPTSVTVIAIIGIVLAGLMILCSGLGIIGNLLGAQFQAMQPPGTPQPPQVMQTWGIATSVVALLLWLWLLVGSIGSLGLKPWARKSMITYAMAHIAVGIIQLLLTVLWIRPQMEQWMSAQMAASGQGGAPPAAMSGIIRGSLIGGAIIGWILVSILPIFILIFYRKPNVVAAFEGAGGARGGVPYGQPGGYPPGGGYGG